MRSYCPESLPDFEPELRGVRLEREAGFDDGYLVYLTVETQGLVMLDSRSVLESAEQAATGSTDFDKQPGAKYSPCQLFALNGLCTGRD